MWSSIAINLQYCSTILNLNHLYILQTTGPKTIWPSKFVVKMILRSSLFILIFRILAFFVFPCKTSCPSQAKVNTRAREMWLVAQPVPSCSDSIGCCSHPPAVTTCISVGPHVCVRSRTCIYVLSRLGLWRFGPSLYYAHARLGT